MLRAVLGDRQARGARCRPCHPGAAGPHVPSTLSLGDIPQTQSHCLPSALGPSRFSEAPSRSLLPAPPENTRGPQSPEASPPPGRPASESPTFLAQQVRGPSSACLLTCSFFLFFLRKRWVFSPLYPSGWEALTKPRAKSSHRPRAAAPSPPAAASRGPSEYHCHCRSEESTKG